MHRNLFDILYVTPPSSKQNAPLSSRKSSSKRKSILHNKRKSIGSAPSSQGMSFRDEQLLNYFSDNKKCNSPTPQSPYSSTLSKLSQVCIDDVENIPPYLKNMLPLENLSGKSKSSEGKSSPQCGAVAEPVKFTTPRHNPVYDKIRRDLNSPSAAARVRALKALKSPGKITQYCQYDIPQEEMDIITEEERQPVVEPQNIQEVFKDVIFYVEVRSGCDNRTEGIKKIVSQLGARVNDKFIRSTTHVLFKDGLLTTYKKAKQWNIPLVSILFVEACKKFIRLVDPKYYPISNIEKYENPEIYKKSRKYQSMQPKYNNNVINVPSLNKNNAIEEKELDDESDEDEEDDIFQTKSSASKINKLVPSASPAKKQPIIPAKPISIKKPAVTVPTHSLSGRKLGSIKKSLFPDVLRKVGGNEQSVDALNSVLSESVYAVNAKLKPQSTPISELRKSSRKSTSIYATPQQSKTLETPKNKTNARRKTMCVQLNEKDTSPILKTPLASHPALSKEMSLIGNSEKSTSARRKTIYTTYAMDESVGQPPSDTVYTPKAMEYSIATPKPADPANRRRTLYTPNSFIIEDNRNFIVKSQLLTETEKAATLIPQKPTPSAKNRRKTVFDLRTSTHTPFIPDVIEEATQSLNEIPTGPEPNTPIASSEMTDSHDFETATYVTATKEMIIPQVSKKRLLFNPSILNELTTDGDMVALAKTDDTYGKRQHDNDETDLNIAKKVKLNEAKIPAVMDTKFKAAHFSRRSTLDFSSIRTYSQKTATEALRPVASQKVEQSKSYMVLTNMHRPQIDLIKEAINKLGRFELDDTVTERTTHIVTLEPRRTINLLRGIIRGLWILNYNWIIDSVKSGTWIIEEMYELKTFSKTVQICRTERQAFGDKFRMDIYADFMEPMFISPHTTVPTAELKELVTLCSGRVTDVRKRAKYIIGERNRTNTNAICVSQLWILDSITANRILNVRKYLIRDNDENFR